MPNNTIVLQNISFVLNVDNETDKWNFQIKSMNEALRAKTPYEPIIFTASNGIRVVSCSYPDFTTLEGVGSIYLRGHNREKDYNRIELTQISDGKAMCIIEAIKQWDKFNGGNAVIASLAQHERFML